MHRAAGLGGGVGVSHHPLARPSPAARREEWGPHWGSCLWRTACRPFPGDGGLVGRERVCLSYSCAQAQAEHVLQGSAGVGAALGPVAATAHAC